MSRPGPAQSSLASPLLAARRESRHGYSVDKLVAEGVAFFVILALVSGGASRNQAGQCVAAAGGINAAHEFEQALAPVRDRLAPADFTVTNASTRGRCPM